MQGENGVAVESIGQSDGRLHRGGVRDDHGRIRALAPVVVGDVGLRNPLDSRVRYAARLVGGHGREYDAALAKTLWGRGRAAATP